MDRLHRRCKGRVSQHQDAVPVVRHELRIVSRLRRRPQDGQRQGRRFVRRRHLFLGAHPGQHHRFRSRLGVRPQPLLCLLDGTHAECRRPGYDDRRRVKPGRHRRSQLAHLLVRGNQAGVRHVEPLGDHVVLNLDGGHPGRLQFPHRPVNVHRVAEPVLRVHHQAHVGDPGDPPAVVHHV